MISATVLAFVLTGGMAAAEAPCDTHATEVQVAQLAPEELWTYEQEALFEDAEADFAARQAEVGLVGSTLAREAATASAPVNADGTTLASRGENPTEQK